MFQTDFGRRTWYQSKLTDTEKYFVSRERVEVEKGGVAGDGKRAVGGGAEGMGRDRERERERRRLDVEWEGMWDD